MAFNLDHWRNPRGTIANNFRKHDIEYATHGAVEALKILKFTDFSIQDMAKMTIGLRLRNWTYGPTTNRIV